MTYRDALTEAAQTLTTSGPAVAENAAPDAQLLLAFVLHRGRTWLIARPGETIAPEALATFRALIQRRAAREPLQHLTGTQEFYGLAFRVSPDVLIPRPETEHLVEAVLLWASQRAGVENAGPENFSLVDSVAAMLRIADVGTGSGAIAIALAAHLASADFLAFDISPAALALARRNAHAHGCDQRIAFLQNDLLSHVAPHSLDAVVSNPPYIPTTDAPTLQPEVLAHEPHTALFAGPDGLEIYRRLIPQARKALKAGGLLALEFGFGQRDAVEHLLRGWQDISFQNDYAGIPRIVLATSPAGS